MQQGERGVAVPLRHMSIISLWDAKIVTLSSDFRIRLLKFVSNNMMIDGNKDKPE
jgi:hypothetical protein